MYWAQGMVRQPRSPGGTESVRPVEGTLFLWEKRLVWRGEAAEAFFHSRQVVDSIDENKAFLLHRHPKSITGMQESSAQGSHVSGGGGREEEMKAQGPARGTLHP